MISQVETIGYHQLVDSEKLYLNEFFANVERLQVSEEVIEKAIYLRQLRKMNLGDSLVAATALAHSARLVTRNTDDFKWVPGLQLFNPFA